MICYSRKPEFNSNNLYSDDKTDGQIGDLRTSFQILQFFQVSIVANFEYTVDAR